MRKTAIIKHLYISVVLDDDNFELLLLKIDNQFRQVPFLMLETIYVAGSGIRSLDITQLVSLLNLIAKLSKNHLVKEYSFELNIEKSMLPKLKILKHYQVNRLSFRIITFNNQLLKQMDYCYNNKDIIEAFKTASQLGFNNINFDMSYNLPNQTKKQFMQDCKMIKKLNPVHVCWYENENGAKIKAKPLESERDNDFYFTVNKLMHKQKYFRYELTSFVKKEKYCLHNLAWWTNQLYYAIGTDADGFIYESDNYYLTNSGKNNDLFTITKTLLTQKDYYWKILMMGLHLEQGICFDDVVDSKKAYLYHQNQINQLINKDLLILTDKLLKLSGKGKNFFSNILINLLDE